MIRVSTVETEKNNRVVEYSEILQIYGVIYEPAEYYWRVGEIRKASGWVLYLSVIRIQIPDLLHAILPELIANSVTFKIIRNYDITGTILDGSLGSALIGKVITVYPKDENQALALAKILIKLTSGFRGPNVPTAKSLSSIVYVQYEKPDPENMQPSIISNSPVVWPFNELVVLKPYKRKRLLNYAYYPISILKSDAKGDVIKALYFKNICQIKSCLLKQGRSNMFADDQGRDIQNRLQWQYDLYQELSEDLPLPAIFDYFADGNDKYLAMEFIKGKSLTEMVTFIYRDRTWPDLPSTRKIQLLNIILRVVSIIGRLHEKGYIHRDITPENFLIDRKGNISMIDMELTWNTLSGLPAPPYRLGTFGFMSPEQQRSLIPTEKEDIYGLGGLLLVFFTNLFPMKFDTTSMQRLKKQLLFFIGEKSFANLVSNCLHINPAQRPSLSSINKDLQLYKISIETNKRPDRTSMTTPVHNKQLISSIIQSGINGLVLPMLLTPKKRWASKIQRAENYIGNEQFDMTVYAGWHTGMAGPLWLIAKAKNAGFTITRCQTAYNSSWDYIQEHYFENSDTTLKGFYTGGPGIGLALIEALNCGFIQPDTITLQRLHHCFAQPSEFLDLASGAAGEGIALLGCISYLDYQFIQSALSNRIENIIKSQQPDGSWRLWTNGSKKNDVLTGMDKGVAGVIWFLLSYLNRYPHELVKQTACKGLAWLLRKSIIKDGCPLWSVTTQSKKIDSWSVAYGVPGILLVFIKAFEVFKMSYYREIAEKSLQNIIPRPALMDLTLGNGLVGVGNVYLEAYRVFNNQLWKERADWVASVLINCTQYAEQDFTYWMPQPSNVVTADLFLGNSGIVYFLMRYLNPNKLKHPLDPIR